MPAALHITEEPAVVHLPDRQNHIRRTAGIGINGHHCDHIADLKIRINLMTDLHCLSACYQFIVSALIHGFFRVWIGSEMRAAVCPAEDIILIIHLIIDLIKCHPVFDLVLIAFKTNFRKLHKEINGLSVHEPAVFFGQMIRHLKMRQCDNRLDPIL